MKNAKPANTLFAAHFKFKKRGCLGSKEEKLEMFENPYSFAIIHFCMLWFVPN